MDRINNCTITHTNSNILIPYVESKDSKLYKKLDRLNLGIDLSGDILYCPCNGVVIDTSNIDNIISVTVQYSKTICLRYCNLFESYVTNGQYLLKDAMVGRCKDFVHFELLQATHNSDSNIVYIGPLELYHHDPINILDGSFIFNDNIELEPILPDSTIQTAQNAQTSPYWLENADSGR